MPSPGRNPSRPEEAIVTTKRQLSTVLAILALAFIPSLVADEAPNGRKSFAGNHADERHSLLDAWKKVLRSLAIPGDRQK